MHAIIDGRPTCCDPDRKLGCTWLHYSLCIVPVPSFAIIVDTRWHGARHMYKHACLLRRTSPTRCQQCMHGLRVKCLVHMYVVLAGGRAHDGALGGPLNGIDAYPQHNMRDWQDNGG